MSEAIKKLAAMSRQEKIEMLEKKGFSVSKRNDLDLDFYIIGIGFDFFEDLSDKNGGDLKKIKDYAEHWKKEYTKQYDEELTESESIEKYGENEFFGGKKEAFEDILEFIEKLGQ